MRSIILAAGRSRRLFPITHRKPKCLLPINNETLIDRLIRILYENGVTDIVMVVGFRAKKLQAHVFEHHPNTKFTFVENVDYAHTSAAHSMWLARGYLNQDVIYLNSDVFCDQQIIKEIIEHPKQSVTAVQQNEWDSEEVNVMIDSTNKVLHIGKQISDNDSHGEFIGVTKLGKDFNNLLQTALKSFEASDERLKFAVDAIDSAIQNGGELYAHDVSKYKAREIDTIDDYTIAQELVL